MPNDTQRNDMQPHDMQPHDMQPNDTQPNDTQSNESGLTSGNRDYWGEAGKFYHRVIDYRKPSERIVLNGGTSCVEKQPAQPIGKIAAANRTVESRVPPDNIPEAIASTSPGAWGDGRPESEAAVKSAAAAGSEAATKSAAVTGSEAATKSAAAAGSEAATRSAAVAESAASAERTSAAVPEQASGEGLAQEIASIKEHYIVGKLAGEDLVGRDGRLIVAKNTRISREIVERAEREGKIVDLILSMTLPGLED